MRATTTADRERFFLIGSEVLSPRTIRFWVPSEPVSHLVYAHDGQNLFDPGAINGGWRLHESAPPGMMIVGIDNTAERIAEYTHVTDDIDGGSIGGQG